MVAIRAFLEQVFELLSAFLTVEIVQHTDVQQLKIVDVLVLTMRAAQFEVFAHAKAPRSPSRQ